MATLIQAVDDDPTDVVAGLSLTVGTTYTGRWQGPERLRIREGSAKPAVSATALVARPYETVSVTPITGEEIYLWTNVGAGSLVLHAV